MKIAIAVEGETPESLVADTFEDSACLLIVETDDRSYTVFENPDRPGGSGLGMAQKIIEQDCEALISGTIEKPAFEVLALAQVTRYVGTGCRAMAALGLMEAYQLDLIRVPNGEQWVPHNHGKGVCDCGRDEE